MKTPQNLLPLAVLLAVATASGLNYSSFAANVTKAGTGTDLTSGASWTGGAAPGTNDVATWDTGSLGSGLSLNSGTPSWLGIKVNAGATDPINIGSGGTLTNGTAGIDLSGSTVNATLGCDLSLASGYQSWTVASGKTLAINGNVARAAGASMSFPATGVTTTTLANDTTGILGGWATVTGTADWAANNGSGNMITYASYTAVSGTVAPSAAQNWKTTATATLSGSGTINSANVVGGDLAVGANTLTLGGGGLILGSTERWVSGTGGTLKSGLSTGELFVHANTAAFANGFQIQPAIPDETPGTLATTVIKDGSGQVEMGNGNNTFSGGFYLNAGAVYLGASSTGLGTAVTKGPLGTGTVTLNGGTLYPYGKINGNYSSGAVGWTLGNNINIPAGASATINNGGGTGILNGNLTGNAPGFQGSGLTALFGTNSYSGGTTISAGTLGVGNVAGTNQNLSAGTVTVNSGGTLRVGYSVTSNQNRTYTTNSITLAGGTIYEDDAFQHLTGPLNVTAASIVGSTYNGGGTDADKGLYVDGLVGGSGALTVQISHYNTAHSYDTSYVAFTNNNNTYSGTITINENSASTEGGVYLGVNGSTALANATINVSAAVPGSTLRFGTSPVVFYTRLGSATLGALAGGGPLVLAGYDPVNHTYTGGGNIALTVGGNNSDTTYAGAISGGGSLTKSGTGTLTLAGASTYTGATTISGGALNLSGSLAATPITVSAGGTLAETGAGVISGATGLTNNGTTTLAGTNTYTGNTTISAGTLALSGAGSLASPNIIVNSGAVFDVSAQTTPTLAANQTLSGNGTVNGPLTTVATTQIYPGTDGAAGTLTFASNLTLNVSSTLKLDLSSTYNGANDQIVLAGNATTLTPNGAQITINSAGTLDTTADYVLVNLTGAGAGISGSFNSVPAWAGATPANAANYSIVTTSTQVSLHYNSSVPLSGVGAASPSTLSHGQTTLLTVTVTPGTSPASTGIAVTGDLSSIGGSATQTFYDDGTHGDAVAGDNVFSWSAAIPAGTGLGGKTLNVSVTDAQSRSSSPVIALTIVPAYETWVAAPADANWGTAANWTNGVSPAANDLVFFDTSSETSPNLETAYSVDSVTFNAAAGAYTIGGSTLTLTGAGVTNNSASSQTISAPVALNSAQTVNAAAGNVTLAGQVSGGSLTKAGTGQLTLSAANTYSGGTTLAAGQLNVNNNSALGTGTLTVSGGTLDNTSAGDVTLGSLAQNWSGSFAYAGSVHNLNLGNGAVTLAASPTVTVSANTLTVGGAISGSGFGLTKAGAGTLVLAGAGSYTGATTLSAGTLQLQNASALAGSALTLSGGTTLSLQADADTTFAPASLGALDVNTYNFTVNSINSPAGNGHTLTLTGQTSGTGASTTTINVSSTTSDTLKFGTAAAYVLDANSGSAWGGINTAFNLTGANVILNGLSTLGTGDGYITFASTTGNSLTINGTVTCGTSRTIGATVNSGVLILNNTVSQSGSGNHGFYVNLNGGTLDLNNAGAINNNAAIGGAGNRAGLAIAGGTLDNTSGATVTLSANPTVAFNGDFTFAGTYGLNLGTGAVSLNNNRTVTVSANTLTIGGAISGAGYGLTKTGNGTLKLSGANVFTGDTTIGAGNLALGADNAIPSGTGTGNLVLNPASGTATFDLGAYNQTVNSLSSSGTGNAVVDLTTASASKTLTVGTTAANPNSTFAGVIQNSGVGAILALTKAGSGTLTLAGTNTYTGNTTITAGTLALGVNGSISNSATVVLAAGATFDVSAIASFSLSSSTTLNAAGTSSAATITGALGGTVDLGARPLVLTFDGTHPALTISQGTLALNGNAFTVNAASPLASGNYTIVQQATGSITAGGSFTVTGTAIDSAHYGAVSVSGGNVVLTVAANPTAGSAGYARAPGVGIKIFVSDLLTNDTVDTVLGYTTNYVSCDAATANGVSLATSGSGNNTIVLYPSSATNIADSFHYTMSDGHGGTATGTVSISINTSVTGQSASITVSGGNASIKFFGIPGYHYIVQRSTDLTNWTNIIVTSTDAANVDNSNGYSILTAPSAGGFTITDNSAPSGSAYYQLLAAP